MKNVTVPRDWKSVISTYREVREGSESKVLEQIREDRRRVERESRYVSEGFKIDVVSE